VTNDIVDLEYVLVATFFDGLLSKEKRANEAYEDICEILRQEANVYAQKANS